MAQAPAEVPPAQPQPNNIALPPPAINFQDYYVQEIPANKKIIFDVLGIKFVKMMKGETTYFVYFGSLLEVVQRLNLYA